jgi:HAD superfamily hydrolase (TIGR01459 family)
MTAPPAPEIITGLSAIAGRYDVLLCDVWGVIHNGREAFPAACEALSRFAATRGPVVLISNAPRPSSAVALQLDRLGVPRAAWSGFVTSGDATRALLTAIAPGPVWKIGAEKDAPLYEGLDLDFAGPGDAAFICCSGLENDLVETPEDYRGRLEIAAARGLPMICANPDRMVHFGEQLIWCAGGVADLYETMGGRVTMAGKPYAAIYDLALTDAKARLDRDLDPRRVLCIGDGAPTDLAGANNQGLDVLFVAGGLHGDDVLNADGEMDSAGVAQWLSGQGVSATSAIASLVW